MKPSTNIAQDIVTRATEAQAGDMSPAYTAGVALELSALITELQEHLEPLKEVLRGTARSVLQARGQASGKISLEGRCPDTDVFLGEVWVTFPVTKLALGKSVDPSGIENFDAYFDTKTTYSPRKGLRELVTSRIASGDKSAQKILEVCSLKESTPRVGFRPSPDILVAGGDS